MSAASTAATIVQIKKRDGRLVPFDQSKIADAILKAFQATYQPDSGPVAAQLAEEVRTLLEVEGDPVPEVEHVQDLVERVLMDSGYAQTAKAYILYRDQRSRAREMNTRLMKLYEDIAFSPAKASDLKRENANIDGDTAMGAMLKFGSEGAKEFYNKFVLNPEHARAHREGDIHIHDLAFLTLTTTSCQIDLLKLFRSGFSTGHGALREPNDIASYAALACIAIQSNQNDQHGGQSIVHFDYGMAPGVRKTFVRLYRKNLAKALTLLSGVEEAEALLTPILAQLREQGLEPTLENWGAYRRAEAEALAGQIAADILERAQTFAHAQAVQEADRATYQAMEALISNLNTMHARAGAQPPFSSLNYGMDTTPEGRMVMKNVLLATEAGLGNGETPIFPIQIFRVKEGVNYNPGEPNYDLFQLAMRCSAKRLFPNFSFLDAPFNLPYYKSGHPETEIAYMGCRTRVIDNVYDPSREICNGRGNLSTTTINLPRLAIQAKGDLRRFFDGLDRMLDLCVEQLLERLEIQSRKRVRNYPFLMGQGVWLDAEQLDWDDVVREVLKHGTLSVGFIGLAETLKALVGVHHGESEQAQALGLEIISHMRARMDAESSKRGLNFTLLATPAEGLTGRFVKLDKARFGVIPGVTDRDYYTNSFHIPVYFPISVCDKLRLEAPYHALTNAGHISCIEMDGDPAQDLEAFERVIRAMKEAGIGYGSVNHPVDRDPLCGFSGVIGDRCPGCGRTEDGVPFERIRRITDYLADAPDRFNNAKQAEERDRVKHAL